MKTVLVYCQSQNVTDDSFSKTVQKLSGIYCQDSPLSLLPCEDDIQLMNIYKKYSKKHQIVITHELYSYISLNFDEMLQGYEITDKYYDDDGNLSGYIAKRNYHTVIVLPSSEKQIDDIICDAFCNEIFKPNLKHAHCTVSVTNLESIEIKKEIDAHIKSDNLYVATVKNGNIVDIYVFGAAKNRIDALDHCKSQINEICDLFGENVFIDDLNSLAGNIVKNLLAKNLKVATAESCTAGMVSSAITSAPNSSSVFEIGISSYSKRIKNAALGVSKDILKEYGAVSPETAIAMAKGIKNLSGADIGISVTGVAGPSPSEGKPVGTVYVALTAQNYCWVIKLNLSDLKGRDAIRKKATYETLELLRRYLACLPSLLAGGSVMNTPYKLLATQPSSKNDGSLINPEIEGNLEAVNRGTFEYTLSPESSYTDNNNMISEKSRKISAIKGFFCDLKYACINFFKRLNNKRAARVVSILLALAILFGSGCVFAYFKEKRDNDKLQDKLCDTWNTKISHTAINNAPYFESLHKISPNIISWLSIPGCVEGPIGKNADNTYYEKFNIIGEKSSYGAFHYDKGAVIGGPNQTKNLIVYGNDTSDESMFGSLKNYTSFSYLKAHSAITLYQPDSFKEYHIFAVSIISEDIEKSGDDFKYLNSDISSAPDFYDYITGIKERSIYTTVAAISNDSELITLVTQSDVFEGAKLVITAFANPNLVLEDNYSNTLHINPTPKYPKIWYEIHGIKDPYKRQTQYSENTQSENSSQKTESTNTEISSASVSSDNTSKAASSSKKSTTTSANTSSKKKTPTTSRVTSSRRQNSEKPTSKPESKTESTAVSTPSKPTETSVPEPPTESTTESQSVTE